MTLLNIGYAASANFTTVMKAVMRVLGERFVYHHRREELFRAVRDGGRPRFPVRDLLFPQNSSLRRPTCFSRTRLDFLVKMKLYEHLELLISTSYL